LFHSVTTPMWYRVTEKISQLHFSKDVQ
jgi:hypothetical protein